MRLVTHNLLHEAASFENARTVDWFSIRELSVFIDLFCLYDDIAALDWNLRSFPRDGSSEFFALLEEEEFVRSCDSQLDIRVKSATSGRLASFLGGNVPIDACRDVVELCTNAEFVQRVAAFFPREQAQFKRGWDWLHTIGPGENLRKKFEGDSEILLSSVFLVRTFVYASLAEVWQMPFTADQVRSKTLLLMNSEEQNLRQRIIETLSTAFKQQPLGDDFGLTRNVTPLAGIVFDRAAPDKHRIAKEMALLRKELAPLRERLREAESLIQTGTAEHEMAAKRKWNRAFEQLNREFGDGDGSVVFRPTLEFAAITSKILLEPMATGKWVDAIMGQPAERLLGMLNRKPLIELHRLRRKMPATGRLSRKIAKMLDPA
jgi:hypothetical protein